MICPKCKEEGKKSTVTKGSCISTLAYFPVWYDELGYEHRHDNNTVTQTYLCSNGHAFFENISHLSHCPTCGPKENWIHKNNYLTTSGISV
jgi:Zn finger protein HypA/HybF involved in hydrogenase expression